MDNVLHPSSQCYTEPFHSIPPILLCLPSNPWQPLISFPILSPAFYLLFYFCLFTALQLIFFLKNSFWTIVGLQCCVSFRCTVKWFSYTCACIDVPSAVSDSLRPYGACQAPLSMGLSRQEYWSGLPFPPPGDLSDLGIKPKSPALAGRFFTTEPPGKPLDTRH